MRLEVRDYLVIDNILLFREFGLNIFGDLRNELGRKRRALVRGGTSRGSICLYTRGDLPVAGKATPTSNVTMLLCPRRRRCYFGSWSG